MQAEKTYHKCGHPVLLVKKPVGIAVETFFIDGDNPFIEGKDGKKSPRVITRCPCCDGSIKIEKLLTQKPEVENVKRSSGYISIRT